MSGGEERVFWPTAEHRAELRAQGILPLSKIGIRFGLVAAIAVWLLARRTSLADCLALGTLSYTSRLQALAGLCLELGAISVGSVLILGLAQTRGWFRLTELSPNGARLLRPQNPIGFSAIMKSSLMVALVLVAPLLIAHRLTPEALKLTSAPPDMLIPWLSVLVRRLLQAVAITCGTASFVLIVIERFGYLLRNRMTQAEVQQEQRGR